MTLTQANRKANKKGIVITETTNGHFYFKNETTNRKGSAWLRNGSFELPRKIYNEEEASHSDSMNELFRYLNR